MKFLEADGYPFELGGGFQYFFVFIPTWEDEPNLTHISQRGWFNHQIHLKKGLAIKQLENGLVQPNTSI